MTAPDPNADPPCPCITDLESLNHDEVNGPDICITDEGCRMCRRCGRYIPDSEWF